jgi:hypothetical protein
MAWRKAWARNWDARRYCSDACRRWRGNSRVDRDLEGAILTLLEARPGGATICPSEAARAVREHDWRPLMERTRAAARRLTARGVLEIVQGGRAVNPSTARGPIRLRLR